MLFLFLVVMSFIKLLLISSLIALMQVGLDPMPSACSAAMGIMNASTLICAFVLFSVNLLFFVVFQITWVSA